MKQSIYNQPFFCSWSGGKDSCLALYHAIQNGGKPQYLLTMMAEDGLTSRSHRLPKILLEEQSKNLGIPIIFRSALWEDYEAEFIAALHEFRKKRIKFGVFGDIDIDTHMGWVKQVCRQTHMIPIHPLWNRNRLELLEEFIALDFTANIIVLKKEKLGKEFLGKKINRETIKKLVKSGVDSSGELGEYHTIVTSGPIFSSKINIKTKRKIQHEGYWFLELEPIMKS